MISLKSVLSHSPSVVARKTGNEYVLVPVTDNIADMISVFTLNDTGAFIWEKINGERNVEELIAAVTEEYDIDKTVASDDVFSFVDKMSKYLMVLS
jgi:hypothetical protein